MKFVEARQVLADALFGWELERQAAAVDFKRLLSAASEVELWAEISLAYEYKRGRVLLEPRAVMRCSRVATHAMTPSFRKQVETLPKRIQREVVALRGKLNGRTYYVDKDDFFPQEQPLPSAVNIEDWNSISLLEYVREAMASFSVLAARPLPATTAEGLLRWVRRRVAANNDDFMLRMMRSWQVTPRAPHNSR